MLVVEVYFSFAGLFGHEKSEGQAPSSNSRRMSTVTLPSC